MPDDAARFREQAERAINPLDKERWLRLAGDWTKMAQDAEARYGKQAARLLCGINWLFRQ
jgi:hypothetical protein